MDRRFLTVLGVSLIFALVVSMVFYKMIAGGGKQQVATDLKDIVVAVKPLGVGVTLKPDDLKLAKIPIAQFPKGAFSKVEEVIDRPVISNILIDEAVLEGRLAARGSGLGLAPIIPIGMRAVTVRVSDIVGVAGFVLPGLRVDVVVTGKPTNSSEDMVTTTVLQNMLVLSAGQTIQADSRGAAISAPNVTLLATPEQAEVLILAGSEGRIQLVLRNGGDQIIQKTPGTTIASIYGDRKAKSVGDMPKPRPQKPRIVMVAAPVAPPPPPPPPPEVIVIRGNHRTVETVTPARGSN